MRIIFLYFLFFLGLSVFAQDHIKIDTLVDKVDLQDYTYHYQNTNDSLMVEDILIKDWTKLSTSSTFSSSNHIHWIKYRLVNPYSVSIERYFFISYHYIQNIDVYEVNNDSVKLLMQTGTSRSFSNKDIKSSGYPIRIVMKPYDTVDYVFKFKHLYLPLRATTFLYSKEKTKEIIYKSYGFLWWWKGVFTTGFFIVALLYIFIRQKIFLVYLGLNLGIGIYIATQLGEYFTFFNIDSSSYISIIDYSGTLLINIFFPWFLNMLVPLKKRNPLVWKWMYWLIYGLIAIWFIRLIPESRNSMFMHYSHLYIISVSIIIFLLQPILLIRSILFKDKYAVALFIIYSFYIVEGFAETILPNLGLFADSPYTNYGIVLASLTEMFVFILLMAKETLAVYIDREKLLNEKQKHQKQLILSVVKSQEEERNRIGRDIHDSLGANMAIIKRHIQKSDDVLYSIVSQSIEMVRNLSHSLITPEMKKEDFKYELKELCHLFTSEIINIQYYFYEWPDIADNSISIHIYRIIQELLKNAVMHSKASDVYLQFMGSNETDINIIYEDNGIGFIPKDESNSGVGLKNIQNRLELINGSMRIESSGNTKGTTIFIDIDLA